MTNLTQKAVESKVDAAIKSSSNNYEIILEALASGMAFAAGSSGRFDPLARLLQGVSAIDREACRQWLINLVRRHGVTISVTPEGQERKGSFFKYNGREMTFKYTQEQATYKEARAKIAALSVDDLKKVTLGKETENREDIERTFSRQNFEDALSRLLKRALVAGALSEAEIEQHNKLIDASKRVSKAALLADAKKAAEAQAERAQKAQDRLNALTGKIENENGNEEKAVPAGVVAEAA